MNSRKLTCFFHSLAKVDLSVQTTKRYYVAKARCGDKANLKNGKLKSTSGQTYEEGTELEFDCMVYFNANYPC